MSNQKKILELLDEVRDENKSSTVDNNTPVPKQRLRTIGQGVTLGFADELEAYTRSMMTGRPVEELLEEIRGGLKLYQEAYPKSAMGYELAGAVAPMLIPGGAPATMGRLATRGAVEGATYGFGTGEGTENRLSRTLPGAVFGVGGSVVGGKLSDVGAKTFEALIDAARRTTGRRGASVVENEIQRIVEQTGKTPEEVMKDIIDGKILAENRTIAATVKAYRGKGGKAAKIIQSALEKRPMQLRKAAQEKLKTELDPIGDSGQTAVRNRASSEKLTAAAEKRGYAPFKAQNVSDDVLSELETILKNNPDIGQILNKAEGRSGNNLYRVDKNGNVIFSRRPSVEEAEKIRRQLQRTADSEFKDPITYGVGEETLELEKGLRSLLNTSVPDLMTTRAQAAAVRTNRDAFTAGRKALAGDVNEVIMEIEDKWAKNPQRLQSFKTGFLAALQGKFTTGQNRTALRKLLQEDQKEGMLLRVLVPDPSDQAKILRKLDIAVESDDVAQIVLKNTQTAETQMAAAAMNRGVTPAESMAAIGGDVNSILSITRKFVDSFSRDLSNAERAKIADILVSTNPQIVLRALKDERGIAEFQKFVNKITPLVKKAGARAGQRESANIGADLFSPVFEEPIRQGIGLLAGGMPQ
jgi:hypothetical protein